MTKSEKEYQYRLANEVGCIICRLFFDEFNDHVSIHHVDGRKKPGAQFNVLPLCGAHHQTGGEGVALHPFKATWERIYGTQKELKIKCDEILNWRRNE